MRLGPVLGVTAGALGVYALTYGVSAATVGGVSWQSVALGGFAASTLAAILAFRRPREGSVLLATAASMSLLATVAAAVTGDCADDKYGCAGDQIVQALPYFAGVSLLIASRLTSNDPQRDPSRCG